MAPLTASASPRLAPPDGREAWKLAGITAVWLALTKGLVAPVLIGSVGLVHLWRSGRLRLLLGTQVAVAALVYALLAIGAATLATYFEPSLTTRPRPLSPS